MHHNHSAPKPASPRRSVVEALHGNQSWPLWVISGPPGAELADAVARVCAPREAADSPESGERFQVITVSIDESTPGFTLSDRLASFPSPRGQTRTILLVEHAERLSPDQLSTLEALVRQLPDTKLTCLCSVALPVPPRSRAPLRRTFDRLRQAGLLTHTIVRPLTPPQVRELITVTTQARPEPALTDRILELGQGWPAVSGIALQAYQDAGLIQVVDRHAYLVTRSGDALHVAADGPLTRGLRRLEPALRRAAGALAVFHPLGDAAVRLTAEALEIPHPAAHALLERLAQTGIVRYRPAEARWRFRLPLLEAAVLALLGPYERRRLAQLAAAAVWAGTVRPADPYYLPDQLLYAGRMGDPGRVKTELLHYAGQAALSDGRRAIPWLRSAADLATDRAERAAILLTHARACLTRGEPATGLESSNTVLRRYAAEVPPGGLLDVCFAHLAILHHAGQLPTLEQVGSGDLWPWPGSELERTVGRGIALTLIGRWNQAREVFDEARRHPDAERVARHIRTFSAVVNLWQGELTEFHAELAALPERAAAGEQVWHEINYHTSALLALGELHQAEEFLTRSGWSAAQLPTRARALLALFNGRTDEALELARTTIATTPPLGCDGPQTTLVHFAAVLQLSRGRLTRSRALVRAAHARRPVLPHLLYMVDALDEMVFGRAETARGLLRTALHEVDERGIVAQTEMLLLFLAETERSAGDTSRLLEYQRRIETVARRTGTGAAEVSRLSLKALIEDDRAAAQAAMDLVRKRAQPFELAVVLARLVRYGMADPALLSEAYALYGDIDALMSRHWLRMEMREHGVPVPGRQAVVAENERLLAVLVAEGLGNKQIATVLSISEKSVEGRLSRLFSRTGYQSRVELAAAMLTGRFEP